MATTVTVQTDQPAAPAAPSVAQAAIATQEPPKQDAQVDAVPEAVVPATVTSFADEDAALAKMEAEQAALDAAKPTTTPSPAPATPAAPAPAVAAPKPPGNSVQDAVIALRKQNRELRDANLILEGERRALSSIASAPAQADVTAEPAPVVDAEIEGIESEYDAIAKQVDDGDLSNVEAEKLRREVRARERAILEERVASVAATPVNDLGLQESLTQLVSNFPVLNKLNKAQLQPFEELAYQAAEMRGDPIPGGPLGTKRLREEMAVLAEQFHDPAAAQARAARKTGNGGQPATGAPAAATPTAAQREAKLQTAGSMPPDIGTIGAAAVGGEMTTAQGEAIFNSLKGEDEQIRWLEQHPQFVEKVMGGSMRLSR